MIILGLGSNLPEPLTHLRKALNVLRSYLTVRQVSPVYISDPLLPDNAPTHWNKTFFNAAIRCETTLSSSELLSLIKKIEKQLGRHLNAEKWSPRVIDIDILAFNDDIIHSEQLTIPHRGLLERPFALWPLSDVAPFWRDPASSKTAAELVERWGSRFTGEAPFSTQQILQRIDTPLLMGILNITNDSFSDGGLFLERDNAIAKLHELIQAGADIIDIGAESTRPQAIPIDNNEEWQRLKPVLSQLQHELSKCAVKPLISIDTRHPDVLEKALDYPIDWINDVSGLENEKMRDLVRNANKECVIMHHLRIPEDRQFVLSRATDPLHPVLSFAKKRLDEIEKYGIDLNKIIFDPGIGFGKLAEQSLYLLQHAAELKMLGTRILIGHSRKSFMSIFTEVSSKERDLETAIISLYLATNKIDVLRVHDVSMLARAFRVNALFTKPTI